MKIIRYTLFVIFITLFAPVTVMAVDFGLTINQYAGYGSPYGDKNDFEYRANILPYFSTLIGDTGNFVLSAGMTLGYQDKKFYYVPELFNTEFSMLFGNFGIKAGRIFYSDPLTFIAEGLFDGLQFSHNSTAGQFSLGAWYTGFLYKNNINIGMTDNDRALNSMELDYKKFGKTYFATKRLITSLDYEHPSIAEILRLKAAITAQFDFNDVDESEKYQSQYLSVSLGLPVKRFFFEASGSFSMAQVKSKNSITSVIEDSFKMALAWSAGFFWMPASSFDNRLSFNVHSAGGKTKDAAAFIPVTVKNFGQIYTPGMEALTVLDLNYSARIIEQLGASVSAVYYVRNDLVTNSELAKNGKDKSYFIGLEFFGRLTWSPFSDLQIILDGGVFIPSLGNVIPKSNPYWRVGLSANLAIY